MSMPPGIADLDESVDAPLSHATDQDAASGIKLDDRAEEEQLSRSDPPTMEPAPRRVLVVEQVHLLMRLSMIR